MKLLRTLASLAALALAWPAEAQVIDLRQPWLIVATLPATCTYARPLVFVTTAGADFGLHQCDEGVLQPAGGSVTKAEPSRTIVSGTVTAGAGWTESPAGTWTHTPGSTAALTWTATDDVVQGAVYRFQYVRGEGSNDTGIDVDGGDVFARVGWNGYDDDVFWVATTLDMDAGLVVTFTPQSGFDGTLVFSDEATHAEMHEMPVFLTARVAYAEPEQDVIVGGKLVWNDQDGLSIGWQFFDDFGHRYAGFRFGWSDADKGWMGVSNHCPDGSSYAWFSSREWFHGLYGDETASPGITYESDYGEGWVGMWEGTTPGADKAGGTGIYSSVVAVVESGDKIVMDALGEIRMRSGLIAACSAGQTAPVTWSVDEDGNITATRGSCS